MMKYILPIAFMSIFFMTCSSEKETHKEATKVNAKEEQVQETPAPTSTTTSSETSQPPVQNELASDQQAAFVVGTSMNAATSMVVTCLGIENDDLDKEKFQIVYKAVQKAFESITQFKENNPNYFASDSPHTAFMKAFTNFSKAADDLAKQLDSGNAKNYNAALSKAYNGLTKVYGGM